MAPNLISPSGLVTSMALGLGLVTSMAPNLTNLWSVPVDKKPAQPRPALGSQDILSNGNGRRYMQKKEEGGGRNKGTIEKDHPDNL